MRGAREEVKYCAERSAGADVHRRFAQILDPARLEVGEVSFIAQALREGIYAE